jgi:hypothetical protein
MGREILYRAGGQGRGSRDNKPKTYNGSSKALEMKSIPHGIGKEGQQTATYQTVKDYIIQLVQKSFRNGKDVALHKKDGQNQHDVEDSNKEVIRSDKC